MDEKISNLVQYLLHQCTPLDVACEELGLDEVTFEELRQIDEEIFTCEQCGYWCEVCEKNDACGIAVCDDCFSDDYEEE